MKDLLLSYGTNESCIPFMRTPSVVMIFLIVTTVVITLMIRSDELQPFSEDRLTLSSSSQIEYGISSGSRLLSLINEGESLPPLFPLDAADYTGFIFAIFGLMLAAGGGIGGGGILVPIYTLVLDFPIKHAIPLATITVFGGSVANIILNWPKHHPNHPDRSCIDWNLILLMEPMTMAGTLLGTGINNLVPDIVIVVLMFCLLTVTAYGTFVSAIALHKKETLQLKSAETTPLTKSNTEKNGYSQYGSQMDSNGTDSDVVQEEIEECSDPAAWVEAGKLVLLFAVITTINLLKGGSEEEGSETTHTLCGPVCFWASEVAMLLVIFLFTVAVRWDVLQRLRSGKVVRSDIAWNEQNTVTYPGLAITAGLVAGMFGVGGGIVKGPLMLALGVHPAVASATSACMILFTSSTATISFSVFGLVVYDYAAACLLVGFLATLAGQTIMHAVIKQYKRNSYIAFSVGLVVAISAVCMTIESVMALSSN